MSDCTPNQSVTCAVAVPSSPAASTTVNENVPSAPTVTDWPWSEGRPPNCTVRPGADSSDTEPVKIQVVPDTWDAWKFKMTGGLVDTVALTGFETWPQPSVTVA